MTSTSQAVSLSKLVIVVSGGTGAIGAALISDLAKEAAGIVVFARNMRDVPTSANILSVSGSITSPADVQKLCELTLARFGRIDVLVNCAGVVLRKPFLQTDFAQWRESMDTNITGYALLCESILPYMIQNKFGRIINITSRMAAMPLPQMSAYSSSKAAAHMLMRTLAAEVAQQGYADILINDVVPGLTRNKHSSLGQDPAKVVPFIRQLILLPNGGPTGKVYFHGKMIDLFADAQGFSLMKMRAWLRGLFA